MRQCRLVLCRAILLAAVMGAPAWAEPALRAGVLEDAAPYVVRDQGGNLTGFTVELFRLIAARMQRKIDFSTGPEQALFDGLGAGRFDVLPGPIPATPDHAQAMLLLEGYASSEFQFATRPNETLQALPDLHGRRLAVRRDSPYEEWATRNGRRYGFSVVLVSSSAAAAQAVLDGQADASLSGSSIVYYVAATHKNFAPALSLPETRVHESAAVGRSETELRDDMEDALRCLKMDGTVARLSKQWFGRDPDAEDLENLVVPGYGVPGLAGYDPKPRKTHC